MASDASALPADVKGLLDIKPTPAVQNPANVHIRPSQGWRELNFHELWRYRELLWFLALRDIKVRYKQTALGIAWAFIQPIFTMLVFAIFFGYLGGMGRRIDSSVPYTVY